MFRKLLFLSTFFIITHQAFAQDTLILINGKVIPVLNTDLQEYRIAYRKIPDGYTKEYDSQGTPEGSLKKKKSRLRTMDPERVFAIKYRDGTESIIYRPDSLDYLEFSHE